MPAMPMQRRTPGISATMRPAVVAGLAPAEEDASFWATQISRRRRFYAREGARGQYIFDFGRRKQVMSLKTILLRAQASAAQRMAFEHIADRRDRLLGRPRRSGPWPGMLRG